MLKTMFPRPLPEIHAWLIERSTWTGLLLHRRADGGMIATATAWYLHDIRGGVVTEVHGDLPGLTPTARVHLADLLAVLRHELAQPLTAIGSYLNGAQLMLQPGQADVERVRTTLALAAQQVDRGGEAMRLLRDLADGIRDTE
jgi:signal transduction histidine kinase